MKQVAPCLFALLLLAACGSESPESPVSLPSDASSTGLDAFGSPQAAGLPQEEEPEEELPEEEETGMSPGDSDPGLPGVMTGLRARVAWGDGYVVTPAQEITLLAPTLEMPSAPLDGLPDLGELSPEQLDRMAEISALMQERLQPAALQVRGVSQ